MLLDSAPQLTWHSKVVDILGLSDTLPLQGVSSLSMGFDTPCIVRHASLFKSTDFPARFLVSGQFKRNGTLLRLRLEKLGVREARSDAPA